MGSSVAQRFAIDYPERTRGLVLVGSFTNMRDNPSVGELCDAVSTLTDPVDPAFAREFQQSTLARPVPQPFFETVMRECLKVPARVWKTTILGFREVDTSKELSKIKAPTLIMWGDKDVFCPQSDQDTLAAEIADSRLVVYEGAGHALHWEEPARFAADLAAFVESLAKRS
jgi:pimeloyl-ACP methyl ester carboxylesterase